MNDEPIFPIAVDVEEGKIYKWCGCGKTRHQPFCDKKDCERAVEYKAIMNETVYFCACKQTKAPPFCDGSHAKILIEMARKRQKK
ncbi:CDGSH iron-sulfur domain-containing protein [Legionella israelensis]|uniref:CDGSH iron-sulfur domain-containing protein n=1 Tax=Legionella israelensis TaxID=454 RepID=A0A0W0WNW7_9GAMM|nr:CDGSH iron-sulfur domain-containing protein [Legionella israelensis]KTD34013.1 glutamate synthetase [Legionella israelensis]QBR84543.1 CDGSH iron-sulfur domain-containing protein [Legionella israelensis]QBS10653.1 CDGSH iron-sulfur domain-containing protein [Legionella israelensis]QDP72336.1 CDGSH iron-sulfur domain-containing protein [Legionella israelensis]SCX84487.1 Iron-binding zinc finger CDGSH type [Legionella israelensis DSM 19235]